MHGSCNYLIILVSSSKSDCIGSNRNVLYTSAHEWTPTKGNFDRTETTRTIECSECFASIVFYDKWPGKHVSIIAVVQLFYPSSFLETKNNDVKLLFRWDIRNGKLCSSASLYAMKISSFWNFRNVGTYRKVKKYITAAFHPTIEAFFAYSDKKADLNLITKGLQKRRVLASIWR